jgi:hypothetical protein
MDPQSRIYKTINTILFMGIFILIFIFQILPLLAGIPGTENLLIKSGLIQLVTLQNFDIALTIGGVSLGSYIAFNAYLGAKKHQFASFTGKKAEAYGLIYMAIGIFLIFFSLSFITGMWRTM